MEVFIEKFCRRYNLSETDVKALTEQMQEVRFRKKEAIVIEGERNSNLYLIKEGIWRGHYLKVLHRSKADFGKFKTSVSAFRADKGCRSGEG